MPSHIQLRLQDPGAFLPHGWGAVLVDALESSRLSRELDCVLYTVDWGMKGARQAYFDALMMPAKSLKEAAGARVRLFSFFLFLFLISCSTPPVIHGLLDKPGYRMYCTVVLYTIFLVTISETLVREHLFM